MGSFHIVSKLLNRNGFIPNNPKLPLLIYPSVVDLSMQDLASEFERTFQRHHWTGSWRDKIYPYDHYHSNNHECLGIYSGKATVLFGGEGGIIADVQAGDVVVIPAGVSHKCLSASSDFGVVGAYPEGKSVDNCRGTSHEYTLAAQSLSKVPIPRFDPIFGSDGPLLKHWTSLHR